MSETEVTFEQWDACVAAGSCSHSPADNWGRGEQPVTGVSLADAIEYVQWLSAETGESYRLPSEAEWEYAARAGTVGRFNTGDCLISDQANFWGSYPAQGCPDGEYRGQTLPVGSFSPNAFGVHDAHGNVAEWVIDCWNPDYAGAPTDGSAWNTGDCESAVVRGGTYLSYGDLVRSAIRATYPVDWRTVRNGVRVVREATAPN